MSIVVFGSINVDITAYAERLPKPGETVHGTSYLTGLGGKGANQAAAAARLGADVHLVGRIGTDSFAAIARTELAGYGVQLGHVLADPETGTGIAIIGVDARGENVITVIAGANAAVTTADAVRSAAVLGAARVLLLQMEVPLAASLAAAQRVRAAGGTVILDPAPAPAGGLAAEVFAAVDLITPNEHEAGILTGSTPANPAEGLAAARALRSRGVAAAVVKLGHQGTCLSSAAGDLHIPAFAVKAIDTVAAGDCFNGGLADALARGLPLAEAARFASACGALATTRKGAAASAPTRNEVEALLTKGAVA